MRPRGSMSRLARDREKFILSLGPPEGSDITTPRRLRARAETLRQKAQQLLDEAAVLENAAEEIEAARKGRPISGHSTGVLHERAQAHKVDTEVEMAAEHALAISRGQARRFRRKGQETDALTLAAQAKGLSFRALARKVNVSPGLLGLARAGERTIRRDIADKVAALIGFAATRANWPGGISE